MCSVFGYIGKQYSRQIVLQGLARLEYRGYDAAGFACLTDEPVTQLVCVKAEGHLQNLHKKIEIDPIDGKIGIGHTRWATHGGFSLANAHPHFDCNKTIALIHNGIIENHASLKEQLSTNAHSFHSTTDSEIVAHLLENELAMHGFCPKTLASVFSKLEGTFAIVALLKEYPGQLIVARKKSPLCIGLGDGEYFVSSDPLAFADKTNYVTFLPDESFALLSVNGVSLFDFSQQELPFEFKMVKVDDQKLDKAGHEHFMLKEIYEQKKVINDTLAYLNNLHEDLWQQLGITAEYARSLKSINLIGCGTSLLASRIAQFFFESITKLPVQIHLASEFKYGSFFPQDNSVYIAISQSGETADTLEALRLVLSSDVPTICISNVASSSLVRESDGYLLTKAGVEVAVASTKAFSTQVTALYWLANKIALHQGTITEQEMSAAIESIKHAADVLESTLEKYTSVIINVLAPYYARYGRFIFLGRHITYPFAMESALKLQELSYVFALSYPAGELKHGPLALIDSQTPVIIFSHQDPIIYQKLVSNAQEIKARNGHLFVFAFEGQDELINLADNVIIIPKVGALLEPLAMTGVMQFFVYHIAKILDRPIDKPRNLAKSVTVE